VVADIDQVRELLSGCAEVPVLRQRRCQELYPVGLCGVDFGTYLRKQYDIYGRIIREANIKVE